MNYRHQRWTRDDTMGFSAIVLVAFALRLAFALAVRPAPVSDFAWYYARAFGIAHGLGYTIHGYPTAFFPPGWPYFLAGVIWLFGPSIVPALVVQALLNALTAGIVFLIARIVSGRIIGLAAGAAYAFLPGIVEWSATLASEPLYTFLWTLTTYIWLARSTRSLGSFALAGLLLGATALVRPSALLFWVVLLVYLLTVREERKHVARLAAVVVVTVCCMILVVVPWILRDRHVFGTLVVISNNGGVSLYQGNNPRATGGYTDLTNSRILKLMNDPRTEVEADQLAGRLGMQYIVKHPMRDMLVWAHNAKSLYSRDQLVIRFTLRSAHFRESQSPPPSDHLATLVLVLNTALYYALMGFAVIGLALCCVNARTGAGAGWRLLAGMILYNTVLFAPIAGLDRYRYPTMPYFAVFAGIGLVAAVAYASNFFGKSRRCRGITGLKAPSDGGYTGM